ncbi:MAG: hypothetical protein ACU0CO_15885 [Shimia sp.]
MLGFGQGGDVPVLSPQDMFQAHMTQCFLRWGFNFDENDVAVLLLHGKSVDEICRIRSEAPDAVIAHAAQIGRKSGAIDASDLAFHLVKALLGDPLTQQPPDWLA